MLRLIRKWLKAGVIEDGEWKASETGSPQGASISPLLANICLHYVPDLWANQWRQREARGDVIIVRWADDFVVGFQYESDAKRFHADLRDRFKQFSLELHPDKTRLIRFGRFARRDSKRFDGRSKPETFDFLGFTHYCGVNHAIPGNWKALGAIRTQVTRMWYRTLRRRSHKSRINWDRMTKIAHAVPPARILHPWLEQRYDAMIRVCGIKSSKGRYG